MMKNVIKRSLVLLVMSAVVMCILSTVSYADTQQIDLSNLDTIPEVTPTPTATPTPTTTKTNSTPTPTPTQSKSKTLPQTGSNTEIIFVVGLVTLLGATIYMYKKAVKY